MILKTELEGFRTLLNIITQISDKYKKKTVGESFKHLYMGCTMPKHVMIIWNTIVMSHQSTM